MKQCRKMHALRLVFEFSSLCYTAVQTKLKYWPILRLLDLHFPLSQYRLHIPPHRNEADDHFFV